MQDEDGQTIPSHSVSAGLDYPSVGPEHSWLADIGRAEYRAVDDAQAMEAFALLSMTEGIMPAIESAHALAGALQLGRELGPEAVIVVSLSGRGDKDVDTASRWFGLIDDETPRADLQTVRDQARRAARGTERQAQSRGAAPPPAACARPRRSQPPAPRDAPPWSGTCRSATPTWPAPSTPPTP